MINEKACSTCRVIKPRSAFYPDTRKKDGLYARCKDCHNAANKGNRDTTPKPPRLPASTSRKAERSRIQRQRHPDRHREASRRWEQANPQKIRAQNAVTRALRNGTITRPDTCEQCPATGRIQAHHEDHSKPLVIQWLCARCHKLADLALARAVLDSRDTPQKREEA